MAIQNRSSINDSLLPSRAAQRKQRLLEIENEQRREDAEALKMTEEQHQMLVQSFTSVKAEFSDLDGLSWNAPPQGLHSSQDTRILNDAFVVLTNADLASFSPHDTIRASAASRSRPCSSASPRSPCTTNASFLSSSRIHSNTHAPFPFPPSPSSPTLAVQGILGNCKPSRSRSPVKGLFNTSSHDLYNPYTGCMISDSDAVANSIDSYRSQEGRMSHFSTPAIQSSSSPFVNDSDLEQMMNASPSPPVVIPLRREPSRVFRHLDSHTSF